MNNRLYEYMRLGKEEDEKRYKEELFDTKKIIKISDADIKAYNEAHAKENNKQTSSEQTEVNNDSDNNYYDNYYEKEAPKKVNNAGLYKDDKKESNFYHYRSPFAKNKATANVQENERKDYNTVDSDTCLMGLIGKSDEYNLFPWLHREIGYINDFNYSYNAFDVKNENVEAAIDGGLVLGIKGFNVSGEYKERVIPKLKAIGKSAYLIGAVDTLVYKEDGYYGFNTKMTAVKKCTIADGVMLKDRNVLITGSSDDVCNLIVAAADMKARNILVITSDPAKFDKVVNRVISTYDETEIRIITIEDDYLYEINQLTTIKNFKWICFYTGSDMPDDDDLYERIEVGYDLSFDRPNTEFTSKILACKGATDIGLKMHIYQAVASYELWTGKKIVEGTVDYIYRKLSKKLYK